MKLLGIFRFELRHQLRSVWPWLSFVGLAVFALPFTRGEPLAEALYDDIFLNSPFIVAGTTLFSCLIWLLVAAPVSGEAAARRGDGGASARVHDAHQQGGIPLGTLPGCARSQCADPARGAGGYPARRLPARRASRCGRPVPSRGIPHGIRLHRAAERLRRYGDPVRARDTERPYHGELSRKCLPVLHGLHPRHHPMDPGAAGPGEAAGSDRGHEYAPRDGVGMDNDREEDAAAQPGGLAAVEPALLARDLPGGARIHLPALSPGASPRGHPRERLAGTLWVARDAAIGCARGCSLGTAGQGAPGCRHCPEGTSSHAELDPRRTANPPRRARSQASRSACRSTASALGSR